MHVFEGPHDGVGHLVRGIVEGHSPDSRLVGVLDARSKLIQDVPYWTSLLQVLSKTE